MKLGRIIRAQLILTAVVCVTGYVAYQVLLDDEAKQGLIDLTHTLERSYRQLSDVVNDHIGMVMDDDFVTQNRQQIRNAWADLGF